MPGTDRNASRHPSSSAGGDHVNDPPLSPPLESYEGEFHGVAETETFRFVPVGDLKYKAPEFIVADLIEKASLGLFFGDPGSGKSFIAVDLALSVATGTSFHGRAVMQGAVFYIAGEGHSGFTRRFAAWGHDRGVPLKNALMFKSNRAVQFLEIKSARAVSTAVRELTEEHGQPRLIIVDTLARNFGTGDENSTQDMSQFIAAIDNMKAEFPDSTVLIVHHSGHSDRQRARGAIALKGALDFEYRIEKKGDLVRMVNTNMKDAEPPKDLHLTLASVDLGDGASSAVLHETDAPEQANKLTPNQKLAIDTYVTAAREGGIWEDGTFRGVPTKDWRAAFYAKHKGDSSDAKKRAFQRARNDLQASGKISVSDDFYMLHDASRQLEILCCGTSGT